MTRICLYFREPDPDRWFPGDRGVRRVVRRIVRGKPRVGGVRRVFLNLKRGLELMGAECVVNPLNGAVRPDDWVAALGVGRAALEGYDRANPVVAGIALMNAPLDWPTLFDDHPISIYLQHSEWAAALYRPYFGDRVGVWPVGVDTAVWAPATGGKTTDVLIYQKTGEVDAAEAARLMEMIQADLSRARLSHRLIRYGHYRQAEYAQALSQSRAMVFVSPRESQGLACQEALASGVPILAWDPGIEIRAAPGVMVTSTSTPFFDLRCGHKFRSPEAFASALETFWPAVQADAFSPRAFILETLTLERSASAFMDFLRAANRQAPGPASAA